MAKAKPVHPYACGAPAGEEEKREGRRRPSSLSRFFKNLIGSKDETAGDIALQFAFQLKTTDKLYTLYTHTLQEASEWTRVLTLLINMVRRQLPLSVVNLFDYEAYLDRRKALRRQQVIDGVDQSQKSSTPPFKGDSSSGDRANAGAPPSDSSGKQSKTITTEEKGI